MTPKRKFYTGNYPGSLSGYDPNVPLGKNHWDENEIEKENEIEEEPEEVIPDEDWIVHDDEDETDI